MIKMEMPQKSFPVNRKKDSVFSEERIYFFLFPPMLKA